METLLEHYSVDNILFNANDYSKEELDIYKLAHRKGIGTQKVDQEYLKIGSQRFNVLNRKNVTDENESSLVLYTELNSYSFLFMGDSTTKEESAIMNEYVLPKIDVFKVGHHGSKTSTSENLIGQIRPQYAVISVGENNRYGHPTREVLERLKESVLYRTDLDGSITFRVRKNKLVIDQ